MEAHVCAHHVCALHVQRRVLVNVSRCVGVHNMSVCMHVQMTACVYVVEVHVLT